MKRIVVTSFLVLMIGAFWQSLANYLPGWANLFFLPPLVLVFSLQFFRGFETLFICLICGLISDILGGLLLGSNMLLMLFLTFILSMFNIFSGRLHQQVQIYYVVLVSFIYRVLSLILSLIFLGNKANIFLTQLLLGPLIDGLISIVFFKLLVKMLSLVKAIDQSEFFNNRLGLR